jgi:tight adherence protein C
MLSAIALLTIGGCGTVLFAFYAWSTSQDRQLLRVRSRVRELSHATTGGRTVASIAARAEPASSSIGGLGRILEGLMPGNETERRHFELRLKQAGLVDPATLIRFFVARMIGLIVPFATILACGYVGVITLHRSLIYAVAAGIFGWLVPSFWLDRRISQRQTELRRSLPDFMDLMIVCLESGMSVVSALQRVTEEINLAHPLLAKELEIVQRDTALGASLDVAFQRFAERSGLDVLRILATFIRESRRFGSEIAEALRSHAESMRFQREQAAEENAQKASVKILFPMLLLILPAVFVVLAGPAVIQIQKAFAK